MRYVARARALFLADRLVREGNDSSGVGATVVRVMGPDLLRHWTIEDVDKCLMKKGL